MGAVRQRCDCG